MINLAQMLISLFTTGGRINPIALIIFAATVVLGYKHYILTMEHRELARQQQVVSKASEEKVKTLNEARNEQQEANKAIDNGEFDNDFLKRLQDLD